MKARTPSSAVVFRAQAGIGLGEPAALAGVLRVLLAQDELRPRHVVAGGDAAGQRLVLSEATLDRVTRAIIEGGGGRIQGGERGDGFRLEVNLWRERLPWRRDEIAWELPEAYFRGDARNTRSARTLEMSASLCGLVEPVWAYGHWAADESALASAINCDPRPWPPLLGAYWLNVIGGRWLERLGPDRVHQLPAAWHVSGLSGGAVMIVLYPNPLECGAPSARQAARTAAACLDTPSLRAEIEKAERAEWEAWCNREPAAEEVSLRSAIEHNAAACLKLYGSRLGSGAEVDAASLSAIESHLRAASQSSRDDEDTFVLLHGSLLGEVLVRRFEGHWLLGRPVQQSVVVFPDDVVEPYRIARERWAGDEQVRLDGPLLDRQAGS